MNFNSRSSIAFKMAILLDSTEIPTAKYIIGKAQVPLLLR